MTVRHGWRGNEGAEFSNNCFAIRDSPVLFDAIQKLRSHFHRVVAFHGMKGDQCEFHLIIAQEIQVFLLYAKEICSAPRLRSHDPSGDRVPHDF
jgi:hypothetical protein